MKKFILLGSPILVHWISQSLQIIICWQLIAASKEETGYN